MLHHDVLVVGGFLREAAVTRPKFGMEVRSEEKALECAFQDAVMRALRGAGLAVGGVNGANTGAREGLGAALHATVSGEHGEGQGLQLRGARASYSHSDMSCYEETTPGDDNVAMTKATTVMMTVVMTLIPALTVRACRCRRASRRSWCCRWAVPWGAGGRDWWKVLASSSNAFSILGS